MLDYQNVVDFITAYMYVLAPIAVIIKIVEISTNFFLSFIGGQRRVNL